VTAWHFVLYNEVQRHLMVGSWQIAERNAMPGSIKGAMQMAKE
jgi:hypothetical protein